MNNDEIRYSKDFIRQQIKSLRKMRREYPSKKASIDLCIKGIESELRKNQDMEVTLDNCVSIINRLMLQLSEEIADTITPRGLLV